MSWAFEFSDSAKKQFSKLGHTAQKEIAAFIRKRSASKENPRRFGKPLKGELAGLWRYRVGDYRILCQIQDEKVVVLVVGIGHRREIYH